MRKGVAEGAGRQALRTPLCRFLCEVGHGSALSSRSPHLTRGILLSFPVTSQDSEGEGKAVCGATETDRAGA